LARSPLLLAFALALGPTAACGETYIDTSLIDNDADVAPADGGTSEAGDAETDGSSAGPTTDTESREFAATLELFALHAREISEVVADDRERAASMLDDLEADWSLIEGIIRAEQPDRLFGFSQAVDLVRSGVERNRPADVSKGWKLLADLSADYPA
jgi:hypothetical protein